MTYKNLSRMPAHLRESINSVLLIEFRNPNHGTWREIAAKINETFSPVSDEPVFLDGEFVRDVYRRRMGRRNKSAGTSPIFDVDTPPPPDMERLQHELRQVHEVNKRLYGQLLSAKSRAEELVRVTIEGARDASLSLGPIGPTLRPSLADRAKNDEAALWHLTDWQGAKKTTSYNSDIMAERVMRFCRKAELITNIQRADHPVRDCVILFGGDLVEGLFQFPTQPFEVDATIFGQFVTVSRLVVQVVQYALAIYEHVTVVAEWGNHGRIGSKRDSVPRSDNFDRMVYELSRQLLRDESRLTWEDCPEDIQRIEIGSYRAVLIHGDEVGRNGYASPMTIVNHINRWKSGAYSWPFRDCYIGHYHSHACWPLADGLGSVYQTGSTESDNRYAGVMLAATATPSQRLHFIDKERGRVSAEYKVYVNAD